MVSDKVTQLLTAFVDGELNAADRQAALRLLEGSSEARELLLQLQENAHKLRQLPRRTLGKDFAGDVVKAIAARKRSAEPATVSRRRVRWLPHFAAAAAAVALFLGISAVGLYIAFNHDELLPHGEQPQNNVVKIPDAPWPVERDPVPQPPPPRKAPNPLIAQVVDGVFSQFAAPIPPERNARFAMQDLKNGNAGAELTAEVQKNKAVQLDLTVKNGAQAADRLAKVLKRHNIKLAVDPASGMKQGRGEFLVYADTLQPEELTKILKELAGDDKAKSPFETVVVASLGTTEDKQVTKLLGGDPTQRDPPGAKQGMINKNPKPDPKAPRVAVVLPQAPAAKASEEVRQFMLQPVSPQAGGVRILLRIRQE